MKSWSAQPVPVLPGSGGSLRLYDTARRTVEPTTPGPVARMYVCGITPYDATHMGHAFTYVTFDLVNRVWRDAGHDVHYVQNVTDIDDPLLERAVQTGQDWQVIAERETALFREDMAALNVLPPRDYIGAVESIPSVAGHVQTLQERGAVYAVDDDLYFRVRSDDSFGSVAGLSEDQMRAVFAEPRRRPGPARQARPAGLPRLAGGPTRRAGMGHPARARSARLAHRVRRHPRWTTSA